MIVSKQPTSSELASVPALAELSCLLSVAAVTAALWRRHSDQSHNATKD